MLIDFRQLFPKYNIKPKGVLHVGANVGEEAPVYDELGIKDVVWVEANPYIIERLRKNVEHYRHRVFNFAASDENGNVNLHESNNGSQSSSILELGTHKIAHPEVHYVRDIPVLMARIQDIFRTVDHISDDKYSIPNIDFLNMDIQGAELKALKGMGDMLHNFKWAYLEVNWEELYKGCALFPEVEAYMKSFGFKVAEYKKCGSTGWGDCLFIRIY